MLAIACRGGVQLLPAPADVATRFAASSTPRCWVVGCRAIDVDGPQLRDRKLTPSALITLLLLKTAPGNSRVPAELRPWASQLRAVLDQPRWQRGVHRALDVH